MTTETLESQVLKTAAPENKTNYLWLNGERVIGIEGLRVFEDCRQLEQISSFKKEQQDTLNNIIHSALEKNREEGICNNWASLISAAKDFFSDNGYCVVKENKITVDIRQMVEVNFQSSIQEKTLEKRKVLTAADLWNIYQQRRTRQQRKFI